MEETKTNSQPSQDSTRRTNGYTIYSDELERAKNYEPGPPPPVVCEFCGKPRYTQGYISRKHIFWMPFPDQCNCPEAVEKAKREEESRIAEERRQEEEKRRQKMREKVARIMGASGIGARFRLRTFDTFDITEENRKAVMICQKYAGAFREKLPVAGKNPGRNGLFITGPQGTGKTHLVVAIANKLISEGIPVICMTMIDLLNRIRQSYADSRQNSYSGYGYSDETGILDTYATVQLLIIDDLGKEQATEWAISKIYAIINARYEAFMPTIVTTNYSEADLIKRLTPKETGDSTTANAAIDRLREMCAAIVTTGESWRTK